MPMPPLPPVNCAYGAPMGRHGRTAPNNDEPRRFYLQRLPLDAGGYDPGGAYWGFGDPLYRYSDTSGEVEGYLRARTREAAKAQIREAYYTATFFK